MEKHIKELIRKTTPTPSLQNNYKYFSFKKNTGKSLNRLPSIFNFNPIKILTKKPLKRPSILVMTVSTICIAIKLAINTIHTRMLAIN